MKKPVLANYRRPNNAKADKKLQIRLERDKLAHRHERIFPCQQALGSCTASCAARTAFILSSWSDVLH
jgi:hypothetical protein